MPETSNSRNKINIIVLAILFILIIFILLILLGFLKKNLNSIAPKKVVKKSENVLGTGTTKNLFYGSNIDMSELLPTSPYYVKNSQGQDLIDIAHHLGINMLRISSVLKSFPDQTPDVIYTKAQWDIVLNKMAKYGMKAEILAETYSTNKNVYNSEISDDYITQMKAYIIDSYVGDDSAVYAIDMKNEPILDEHNLEMLNEERNMIKAKYPWMKVTVGGWKTDAGTTDSQGREVYNWNQPQDAKLLSGMVDFYSPHIYNFDRKVSGKFPDPTALVTNYLDIMEKTDNSKNILINEFGVSNGDSVSDQNLLGSHELQANAYYAVYNALNNYKNVTGAISYVLYSRNQYPESFAILKDNGDYIYPAGYVVQQLSTGNSDVPLTLPFTNVPDDTILTSSNFQASESAKVGDIVALELPLDKTNKYLLNITPSNNVNIIENFEYLPQFSKFFAVFSPKVKGAINVAIDQVPPCNQAECSQAPYYIYTTTLNVQ